MAVTFVMRITFLLLLAVAYGLAEGAPPMAKHNCPDRCGNVLIPYPFGIGSNCFMHKTYEIVCNESGVAAAAIAFLPSIQVKVLEIRLIDPFNIYEDPLSEPGLIRVMMPIFSSNCPNQSSVDERDGVVDISKTPFFFSSYGNIFVSVGCNNKATMVGHDSTVFFGCKTDCNNQKLRGKCTGFDCCQTTVPTSGIQRLNVTLESTTNNMNTCTHAFLAETQWLESNKTDPSNDVQYLDYVPVALAWTSIINLTFTQARRRNMYLYTTSAGASYYYCLGGYEGNPYLSMRCQDINECEDEKQKDPRYQCPPDLECENKEGSYNCNKRKSPLKIAILGVLIGLIVVLICSSCLYLVIKQRKLIKLKQRLFEQNGGLILQQKLNKEGNSVETTKIFTVEELKKATNNYDETLIIGEGGYGMVYKGFLSDNRIVAIKKSKIAEKSQIEQFVNEIIVLSQINHRNVVKILGCCLETPIPLLVYEFIPNGTLFEYIHHESIASTISWETRLRIAAEIAEALSYLHSAASPPIIHRDIKSSNILLDNNYTAKVSDFGASKLVPLDHTQIATLAQGTLGYLDPEYMQTSQLTEKSDVYSFGVVLVELLTSEKAVSFDRPERERSIASYFLSSFKDNRLFEVLEKHIASEGNVEQLKEVANLASRCLRLKGEDRPTMREVTSELEGLRNIEKNSCVDGDVNDNVRDNVTSNLTMGDEISLIEYPS